MPSPATERESLSVRIPGPLKSRAAKAAKARHISINTFVTGLIERAVRETEEQELFDAFTELGAAPDMSDISFAFEAQAEVARRD